MSPNKSPTRFALQFSLCSLAIAACAGHAAPKATADPVVVKDSPPPNVDDAPPVKQTIDSSFVVVLEHVLAPHFEKSSKLEIHHNQDGWQYRTLRFDATYPHASSADDAHAPRASFQTRCSQWKRLSTSLSEVAARVQEPSVRCEGYDELCRLVATNEPSSDLGPGGWYFAAEHRPQDSCE